MGGKAAMQETNCAAGLYDFWLPWAWGHGQFQICLIIRRGRPAIEFSSCAGRTALFKRMRWTGSGAIVERV